ncbi:glutamate 5-kinase [Vampirovibrio sp.]|uniref:glutamate 5-kinase n=1 Tax=Vampirovibrio sp. TaxID=2717857 RepID=UPI0035948B7A
MTLNQPLLSAQRIVIKLGTQVVIDLAGDSGGRFATERLAELTRQCAQLVAQGKEIILVSSGAVGLGRQALHLTGTLSLNDKQACAAVGQNLLMEAYRNLFQQSGLITAQVLLTATDFADRKHYLNLRQTLEALLKFKAIPIINENDTTSTMELQEESYTKGFGDNDMLSALVASKLDADLLVILTNVDGIYTDNPFTNPNAQRISRIENFQDFQKIEASGQSLLGRGGMSSKLEAARMAALSGVHTLITSGVSPQPLEALLAPQPEPVGTLVLPQASFLSGKKRWIGMASGYHGAIVVNAGARKALVEKQASLLAIGVVGAQGDFFAQQVVRILDETGVEIGRGLTHFSSHEIERIKGLQSEKIADRLGFDADGKVLERQEIVHRDNLVIFEEYGV